MGMRVAQQQATTTSLWLGAEILCTPAALVSITIYISLVYGIVYGTLEAFPII